MGEYSPDEIWVETEKKSKNGHFSEESKNYQKSEEKKKFGFFCLTLPKMAGQKPE